jgi:predicted glycosyltransferase
MRFDSEIGNTFHDASTPRAEKGLAKDHALVMFPSRAARGEQDKARARKPRIALYSHDTMGLGHMRRNLLIAQALSSAPLGASVLMVAGACQISKFTLPPGVDCLSLPSLCKNSEGEYGSRNLDVSLQEMSALRARTISAALQGFQPDILVVDNVPRGAVRELDQTLAALRGRTRLILGLRDVLDAPERVRREWERAENFQTIRDYYDAVWVYGDRALYDLVREYDFPADVAAKTRFVGYLDQRARLQSTERGTPDALAALELPAGRLVVCSVGGGQDGVELAEAFANAELPRNHNGVLLTGPFMPAGARRRLEDAAARSPRLRVIEFVNEPLHLLTRADRLISMGGYNTSCEVLSLGIPALVVPRVTPRVEQLLRAERFRALGLADMLHPKRLTPEAISDWLARGPAHASTRWRVDLDGLSRLPLLAEEALASRPPLAGEAFTEGGFRHAAL